jgi:hypothetical protein
MFGPVAHGETPDQTAAGLKKAGANTLLFFTSLYHGYRLLQPRYPQRAIYSLEADRLFFRHDAAFYRDSPIVPEQSRDFPDSHYFPKLIEACHKQGVSFAALVPICAGDRLAPIHPELAVENLYGSRDRMFFCYNNPGLRAYRYAMIRDILTHFDVDRLTLDKIPQSMLEQYSQTTIFDPPLRTVGSFCFCEHCVKAARAHDLDLNEVKARCLEIAARSLRIPPHVITAQGDKLTGDTEIPLLLLEEPLLYRMLKFRFDTAVELVGEVRAILKELRPKAPLQAAFVPPSHPGHDMTAPRSWLTVQSYKLYAKVVDEILAVVHFGPDVVRFETERAVSEAEGQTKVISSMRLYGATRPEEVGLLAEQALAGGSQGISFLGYDVATDELLAALGSWVRQHSAAS